MAGLCVTGAWHRVLLDLCLSTCAGAVYPRYFSRPSALLPAPSRGCSQQGNACLFLSESSLPSTPRGPVASPQDTQDAHGSLRRRCVSNATPGSAWLSVQTHRLTEAGQPPLSLCSPTVLLSLSLVPRWSSEHPHATPTLSPASLRVLSRGTCSVSSALALTPPRRRDSRGWPLLSPCDSECLP